MVGKAEMVGEALTEGERVGEALLGALGALVFLHSFNVTGSAPFAILSHRHTFFASLVVPLGTRDGIDEGSDEVDVEGK